MIQGLKKSPTVDKLEMLQDADYQEWLNNPINAGSIYIKPQEDDIKTLGEYIFQYCWYYCCRCPAISLAVEFLHRPAFFKSGRYKRKNL